MMLPIYAAAITWIRSSLRSFLVKTKAAASLADPAAQKEVALKALNELEELEKKG